MADLSGPSLLPLSGNAPKQLVVLLHGLGANGDDLIDLGRSWAGALPDAVFHAPNAPNPCDMSPFGYQWFSLSESFLSSALYDGASRAAEQLNRAIDGWLAKYKLTDAKLALVGFSQGCMMSLHVGLRRLNPCAAIVGYSGFLIAPERLNAEIASRPPCLLIHGTADMVVPFMAVEPSRAAIAAAGVPVEVETRLGLGHGIDPAGLRRAEDFLKRHLLP